VNYRTRPVFETTIDWGDPVNKSFTYDLKEVADVGFNKSFFTSLQVDTIQGYEFTLRLLSDEAIADVDAFTAALNGRLVGFWLPAPIETVQITAAVSSTQFDVVAQGLTATWQDHPDVHLYFARGGNSAAAKITAVVDNGDGTERVTVDAAVANWATLFTTEAFVQRLHYVRLATDVEEGTFISDGQMDRSFRVLELPAEYAAYEAGEKKIFLYRFWCDPPISVNWYYTSFAADVISRNNQYSSSIAIGHGSYSRGLTLDDETLEISAQYDPNSPLSLFYPVPMSRPMWVQVFETTLGDPDTVKLFFTGRVKAVPEPEDRVIAQCVSFAYLLSQRGPGPLIGPNCPWDVYNPKTCGARRAKFETTGVVTAVDPAAAPPTISVQLNFPTDDRNSDDWFAHGFFETGYGKQYELRLIISSTLDSGVIVLELNAETKYLQVGQTVQLIPGCDGVPSTCQNKFNNYETGFGGFVAVPSKNPSLTSITSPVSQGGKKG
jgi:hypothetical protein